MYREIHICYEVMTRPRFFFLNARNHLNQQRNVKIWPVLGLTVWFFLPTYEKDKHCAQLLQRNWFSAWFSQIKNKKRSLGLTLVVFFDDWQLHPTKPNTSVCTFSGRVCFFCFFLFPASRGVHKNPSVFSEGSKGKDGKRREVENEGIWDSCTDQLFVFWELLCWMSEWRGWSSRRARPLQKPSATPSLWFLTSSLKLLHILSILFFFYLHLLMISAVKNKCFLPTADRRKSQMTPCCQSQVHPLFLGTLSITKNCFLKLFIMLIQF